MMGGVNGLVTCWACKGERNSREEKIYPMVWRHNETDWHSRHTSSARCKTNKENKTHTNKGIMKKMKP